MTLPPVPVANTGNGGMHGPRSTTPVPDPTVLTEQRVAQVAEQLRRELGALQDLVDARMDGMDADRGSQREIIETRLDGMDKAIELLQKTSNELPNRMDEKVQHLGELTGVKFDGITTQFAERDVRTEQTARDAKTAVDAALQAQKESAGKQADSFAEATRKSEDQFTKQIDQQGELIRTATKGLEDKINDLKDRFNRGEGVGMGRTVAVTETRAEQSAQHASSSYVASIIFGVIGAVGLVVGVILALVRP